VTCVTSSVFTWPGWTHGNITNPAPSKLMGSWKGTQAHLALSITTKSHQGHKEKPIQDQGLCVDCLQIRKGTRWDGWGSWGLEQWRSLYHS
jgi:hypothetical protein